MKITKRIIRLETGKTCGVLALLEIRKLSANFSGLTTKLTRFIHCLIRSWVLWGLTIKWLLVWLVQLSSDELLAKCWRLHPLSWLRWLVFVCHRCYLSTQLPLQVAFVDDVNLMSCRIFIRPVFYRRSIIFLYDFVVQLFKWFLLWFYRPITHTELNSPISDAEYRIDSSIAEEDSENRPLTSLRQPKKFRQIVTETSTVTVYAFLPTVIKKTIYPINIPKAGEGLMCIPPGITVC